jgi:hypothetical protein
MPNQEYLESRIAVLETKWYEHSNVSIRDMFDLLSNLTYEHPNAYRYEMFGGKAEFKNAFDRLAEKNGIHYLYIAAHGADDGIQGTMRSDISTTVVSNRISATDDDDTRGRLAGIYFGSCSFGSHKNLERLLKSGNKPRWVAGYNKDVDFVSSTALDLLFFHTHVTHIQSQKKMTELEAIKATASDLKANVGGLMKNLGFSLLMWERRKVVKLI